MLHESTNSNLVARVIRLDVAAIMLVSMVCGCGRAKVERQHLQGSVTYKGQPLAAGQIRFSPTKREGLDGAIGGAEIKAGKYDTRAARGLAAPVGEVQVLVTAIRNPETDSATQAYFPGYSTTLTVTSEMETFDVQVP